MTVPAARSIEDVIALFEGPLLDDAYGENLSIRSHMVQCAMLAADEGAPETLVAAALLHDVGWVIGEPHETTGADWLEPLLGPAVVTPIRLHVTAKRYLVATRRGYVEHLSEQSKRTLVAQGGALSQAAKLEFVQNPWFEDAIRLRLWDDDAKVITDELSFPSPCRELLIRVSQMHQSINPKTA